MERELTCIRCPMGCQMHAVIDDKSISISGNSCERGAEYGEAEVLNPIRTVTGSMIVDNGKMPLLSVKTSSEIPKDRVFDVMAEIKKCIVKAPVSIGQVIIKDVAGTGADIIATRSVAKIKNVLM